MDAKNLSNLIAELYRYTTSPQGWNQFFSSLKQGLDFSSATFMIDDARGELSDQIICFDQPDEVVSAYAGHFAQHDAWALRMLVDPPLSFLGSEEMVARKDLLQTHFYNDFLRDADIRYSCGTYINDPSQGHGVKMTFQRTHRHKPFARGELDFLDLFIPHVNHAVTTYQRLRHQQHAKSALHTPGQHAVFLVDSQHRIIDLNESAQRLLSDQGSRGSGQKLVLKEWALDRAVRRLCQQLFAMVDGQLSAPQLYSRLGHPGSGYQLRADPSPLPASVTGHNEMAALVNIKSYQGEPELSHAGLKALYGLTPTESEIAIGLCRGAATSQIAEQLKVRESTVRSHCKSIYLKVGVNKQSELVTRLLGSLAMK